MEMKIEDEIASAEHEWLEGWKQGPTRLRWTELPLQPGDPAPDVKLMDLAGATVHLNTFWSGGPAVIIFLRHFGCSCAFDRVERLRREFAGYLKAGASVIAIGQGEPARSRRFAEQRGLPCGLLCDPERRAYEAFNLLEARPSQVVYGAPDALLRRDLEAGSQLQQSRHGSERAAVDSPWQLPGEFVVDRGGKLRLTFRSQFCDDYADPQVFLAALREAALGL